MEFTQPKVAEQLLEEMEEKEEQLLVAAEFGNALLERTEALQEENEAMEREREAAVSAAEADSLERGAAEALIQKSVRVVVVLMVVA